MTDTIAELLAQLTVPGTFATRSRAPADTLDIEITGVGQLRFPITARTAKKLRAIARPSPFGLRDQTLHDRKVRDSWEIPASRVKIAAKDFKQILTQHLRSIRSELGFPETAELKAKFDKLLLYEEGQFFKAHQDSEKHDDMVASLVVVLPSEYTGGVLTVEHGGESKTFRRLANQSKDLSLIAFYADCYHAVSPIKCGVRVALTYRLTLANGTNRLNLPLSSDRLDRLTSKVQAHFGTPVTKPYGRSDPASPERLVFLLDHEYTQRSLSWTRLKNSDSVRIAALRNVAERLDCECFLALAEVHESWMCEEDDFHPRYRDSRHRWHDDYDDEDEDEETGEEDLDDDHELIELLDSNVTLTYWVDADGKPVKGVAQSVDEDELHFTMASKDLDPFQSEHEGYQGNYGNTVDRWYHRAAFVMWPRKNAFALRARTSPQWAVDQLLALPPDRTSELESRVKSVLPRWKSTAGHVVELPFFGKLIKLATRIDDPALAREWLVPLRLQRFTNVAMRRELVVLTQKHGLVWAKKMLNEWLDDDDSWETPTWAPLLADICRDLHESQHEPAIALARWLVERELKHACSGCVAAREDILPWLDLDSFSEESKRLAHVLAAAVAITEFKLIDDTLNILLAEKHGFPATFLAKLLQACRARSSALRNHIQQSDLQRACIEKLEARLRKPRSKDDWSISYKLNCKCADCNVLAHFLQSSRIEHDWPLNQVRRGHIHDTIDTAKLPLSHKTLRRGSPFVLQLRKDRSLFTREEAFRTHIEKLLKTLRIQRS